MSSVRGVPGRRWDDPRQIDLGAVIGKLVRALRAEHDSVDATVQAITDSAVAVVVGAEYAGIILGYKRREVVSRAATNEVVALLDRLQSETGDGPCIDALTDERTVRVDDLTGDPRWPELAARAHELGIRSAIAFRLTVGEQTLGSLSLYASTPNAFGAAAENVGRIVAAHAAVALVGAQREAQMVVALGSRDLIGQAKGIIMERYKLDAVIAFAVLVRASQHTNTKLLDVAEQLVTSGDLQRPPPQ